MCPISIETPRILSPDPFHRYSPPTLVEQDRGRSRSRSRSPRRLRPPFIFPNLRSSPTRISRSRSLSRSPSPIWKRYSRPRPRSYSPGDIDIINIPPPSPPPIPIIVQQPPPPQFIPPPSWYAAPPSGVWRTVPPQPVDILTFNYNKNMAYVPATKTYDVRLLSHHTLSCLRACVI
jgi:hypothetical protein